MTLYPTHAAAQNAGLSLARYEDFPFRAMFLDRDDPAQAWRDFSQKQQRYVDYLNGVQARCVWSPVTRTYPCALPGGRGSTRTATATFPAARFSRGRSKTASNGHVRYTFPTAHLGNEVHDIQLTFRAGEVVKAEAARGQAFLEAMLDSDAGARRLGEVAVGNNYGVERYTRNTLYDEKIGGTFHLALGNSYPETGGVNVSSLHWDMVCDMRPEAGGGAIYADGVLIHQDGQWVI